MSDSLDPIVPLFIPDNETVVENPNIEPSVEQEETFPTAPPNHEENDGDYIPDMIPPTEDASLRNIMNPIKVRPPDVHIERNDVEEDIHYQELHQQNKRRRYNEQPIETDPVEFMEDREEPPERAEYHEEPMMFEQQSTLNPMQAKAVERGKLVARFKQLESKGYKSSIKKFDPYKCSLEVLMTEVATAETLVARNMKIQTGRATLMTVVGAEEDAANWFKDQKKQGHYRFIPITPELTGLDQYVYSQIDIFDDSLEQAYDKYLAPIDNIDPLVTILKNLVVLSILFHQENKKAMVDAADRIEKQLMENPDFMERIAQRVTQQNQQAYVNYNLQQQNAREARYQRELQRQNYHAQTTMPSAKQPGDNWGDVPEMIPPPHEQPRAKTAPIPQPMVRQTPRRVEDLQNIPFTEDDLKQQIRGEMSLALNETIDEHAIQSPVFGQELDFS